MTVETEKLDRAKMQQILRAIGSQRDEQQEPQPQCENYDWQQPHIFNEDQLVRLDDFTKQLAQEISRHFVELCHTEFEGEITSTSQHFADQVVEQTTEDTQNRYLAFGATKNAPWGWLCINAETAGMWVTHMLGDSEAELDMEREFSELEISLLQDISSAVVQAIFHCRKAKPIECCDELVQGHIPFEPDQTESLVQIQFGIKKVDSENQSHATVFIPCSQLEEITGRKQARADDYPPEMIKQAMTEHMKNTSITAKAILGKAALTLEQAMKLQPGDTIVLNNKVNEPIEILVDERSFFKACPARSSGKYSVFITDYSVEDDQQH